MVARWIGRNQLTLDAALAEMITRCRKLNLRASGLNDSLWSTSPYVFDGEDHARAVRPVAAQIDRAMSQAKARASAG